MDDVLFLTELNQFTVAKEMLEKLFTEIQFENRQLKKELQEYSKDKEIKKLTELYDCAIEHSLHMLSDKEYKLIKEFRSQHYKLCSNAGTYVFTLSATGIGEGIKIKCPYCGVEKDVTDVDSW